MDATAGCFCGCAAAWSLASTALAHVIRSSLESDAYDRLFIGGVARSQGISGATLLMNPSIPPITARSEDPLRSSNSSTRRRRKSSSGVRRVGTGPPDEEARPGTALRPRSLDKANTQCLGTEVRAQHRPELGDHGRSRGRDVFEGVGQTFGRGSVFGIEHRERR